MTIGGEAKQPKIKKIKLMIREILKFKVLLVFIVLTSVTILISCQKDSEKPVKQAEIFENQPPNKVPKKVQNR